MLHARLEFIDSFASRASFGNPGGSSLYLNPNQGATCKIPTLRRLILREWHFSRSVALYFGDILVRRDAGVDKAASVNCGVLGSAFE